MEFDSIIEDIAEYGKNGMKDENCVEVLDRIKGYRKDLLSAYNSLSPEERSLRSQDYVTAKNTLETVESIVRELSEFASGGIIEEKKKAHMPFECPDSMLKRCMTWLLVPVYAVDALLVLLFMFVAGYWLYEVLLVMALSVSVIVCMYLYMFLSYRKFRVCVHYYIPSWLLRLSINAKYNTRNIRKGNDGSVLEDIQCIRGCLDENETGRLDIYLSEIENYGIRNRRYLYEELRYVVANYEVTGQFMLVPFKQNAHTGYKGCKK